LVGRPLEFPVLDLEAGGTPSSSSDGTMWTESWSISLTAPLPKMLEANLLEKTEGLCEWPCGARSLHDSNFSDPFIKEATDGAGDLYSGIDKSRVRDLDLVF